MENLPYLGVGLGFRKEIAKEINENLSEIDFLELISDHYLNKLPGKEKEAFELAKNFPIVLHGLELSIGTELYLNRKYLDDLVDFVDFIQPRWVSDHLCFTGVEHQGLGTLTPLPFSRRMVEAAANNIKQVKSSINCPFLIENISYLFTIPPYELTEAQFITEVLEKADCHLLLDITNVLNNSANFNYDAYEFMEQIPLERVLQLHLAGGKYQNDLLIDSHDQSLPEEVYKMLAFVLPKTPNLKGIIIERDQNFPPIQELISEIKQVKAIYETTA